MYRVVVRGRVPRSVLDNVDRFELVGSGASQSVFVGVNADQADLYGLLLYLQRLGVELLSVSQGED
ncbi:MAG: hypothetical protein ACRBK7_07470 [Acidimicrobiales bacterium]